MKGVHVYRLGLTASLTWLTLHDSVSFVWRYFAIQLVSGLHSSTKLS